MEYLAVKTCTKCDTDKAVELFSKDARAKDGLTSRCKACDKEYRITNAEAISAKQKIYYAENLEAISAKQKIYNAKNAVAKAAYNKIYNAENSEAISAKKKIYNEKNSEAIAAYNKIHYAENADAICAKNGAYKKANPGKANSLEAKRRAAKLERTPVWSDAKEISLIYQQSASLQKLFGRAMNVDHVVPLQGDLVSGLHAPHNLQIMFAPDNLYKSNKFDIEGFNA